VAARLASTYDTHVSDSGSFVTSSRVPRAALLEAWSTSDWKRGVSIPALSPFDTLTVTTKNSIYTIIIVSPESGEVKIRGGTIFPAFATARLCGSSLGGGLLKRAVIHPGFCVELVHQGLGTIVTTHVQSIALHNGGSAPSSAVM
jgi:hypothetical protein